MAKVTSKDGTEIAYDKTGKGPAVIMVNGALAYRKFYGGRNLSILLSKDFTFIDYDRRGRGESGDTKPYTVEREIEDIEALIAEVGGSAYLYGISSGAALALLAAAKLGSNKITKLALYEAPYGSDSEKDKQDFAKEKKKIQELVEAGKPGDAVTAFISSLGTPSEAIEGMKQSPEWKIMEGVGHTLAYDFAVLDDGTVPLDAAKKVSIPTLVMDGEKSFDFMHDAADTLGKTIPQSQRKTLQNQTHDVSPEALAPVLKEFFNS
jgi:pimeloyl-ACP methyl ester carboxylesterase